MQINVKTNIKQVSRGLSRTQRKQIPFATSRALNDTAWQLTQKGGGNSVLGKKAADTFKKKSGAPGATMHTRRGFKYTKSNKQNLTAYVFWDDARGHYMSFQVYGGTRHPNKRYLRVPTKKSNALLNAFGNFREDRVTKILQDKQKYFEGKPKGFPNAGAGIWERYGRQTKRGSGQRIRMVASYEDKAQYKPLYPFAETVRGYVFGQENAFARNFRKRLKDALRTAR